MVHGDRFAAVTELYQPTLHRLPDDTSGRFQVLREFLLRWHGLVTGSVGRTVDRVGAAEARVQKRLPLAVREWIVLLDDIDRIDGWGVVLRDCWGLKKVPNCPAFALLTAGEDDCHWGPFYRDLAQEDPPTQEFSPDYERSASRFKHSRQVAPRVSTWAIEFIVSYLRLSRSVEIEREMPLDAFSRLRERLPDGVVGSRVGASELLEFPGGLIHADPDGPEQYTLRCYAPVGEGTRDEYQAAKRAFDERLGAMLGPES